MGQSSFAQGELLRRLDAHSARAHDLEQIAGHTNKT